MIALLEASLVRPLGLVVVAWLMLRVLRVRHPMSRHAVWTAVLVGMLVLPIVSVVAPHWTLSVLPSAKNAAVQIPDSTSSVPVPAIADDTTSSPNVPSEQLPVESHASFEWPSTTTLIVWGYAAGVFAMLMYRLMGWILLRRVVSRSTRLRPTYLLESSDVVTPVAVGVLRPSVILPVGWRGWNAQTRRAVLAHEFAHLRRRDTLVAALARCVKCVFWFHPIAWWVSRQTSDLAELACDAVALQRVGDPAGYSRVLVEFANTVSRSGRRASLPGLAMASSSGIGERIDHVFELSSGTMRKLIRPRAWLLAIGLPALCLAATVGLGARSRVTAVTQVTASAPRFDVVSVKPCDPNDPGSHGTRGAGAGAGVSPDRLVEHCLTVFNLIQNAYIRFADGRGRDAWVTLDTPIEGGPDWIKHEPFQIEATAAGATTQEMMRGPMLQAALEDRFHLKIHHETRQGPVYDLTVAAGGLKLKPAKAGVCVPPDYTVFPMPALPDGQHRCGVKGGPVDANGNRSSSPPVGPTYTAAWDDEAISLEDFAHDFLHLDRPVVNKTGIAGLFSVHLTHTFDRADPDDGPPVGNFRVAAAALKAQLGLDLKPSTGARDFLVIDHVERPTPNDQAPMDAPPASAQAVPASAAPSASTQKFEVASIRPCATSGAAPLGRTGGPGASMSPGRVHLDCLTLTQLIRDAYVKFADGNVNQFWQRVPAEGGPAWASSDRYSIDATAPGAPSVSMMRGPMLQAFLEDSFRLKTHREQRSAPVYDLTVAKGGPRLKAFTGGCTPIDFTKPVPAQLEAAGACPNVGKNDEWDARGETIGDFSIWVLALLDRPVVDKTGLAGRYDFHFSIKTDGPIDPADLSPVIALALQQQLGLKLTPSTALQDFLIIDHAERPTIDGGAASRPGARNR